MKINLKIKISKFLNIGHSKCCPPPVSNSGSNIRNKSPNVCVYVCISLKKISYKCSSFYKSRWNHYIIISESRSKVEKTMKNSIFSNFDCEPEIKLKWLQHYGDLQWILPQKTVWSTFFSRKKKNSVRHPKMVVFRF